MYDKGFIGFGLKLFKMSALTEVVLKNVSNMLISPPNMKLQVARGVSSSFVHHATVASPQVLHPEWLIDLMRPI